MKIASLLDDTHLDPEDDDKRSITNAIGRMRRRMRQGSYLALKDGIDDLEELGLHDDWIAKELATVKDDIIAWLDKSLGHVYTDRLVNQILMLVDIGLQWPEITRSLDAHKDAVVKSMLQRLSQDSADPIVLLHLRSYIERFSKMGIRWPELRIIWKSIASTLNDRDLDEGKSSKRVPKVIRKEVDEFIAACEKGNWLKAMERLFWIGGYSVLPMEAERLEPYKHSLIKGLLAEFKELGGDDEDGMIGDAISGLKEMGVDWPELDIIQRSLTATSSIDLEEDEASDKPSWHMDIADALTQGNIYKALNIIRMHELEIEEYPMLDPLLDSFKWVFIRHLDRSLKDEFDGFDETVRLLKQIRKVGVKWPEMDTFWDDHKPAVMKQLFRQITSNDEHAGYYTWEELNILKAAGVKWPELDIVLKSALAVMGEKDQKEISEDDDHEDRRREMRQDAADDEYDDNDTAFREKITSLRSFDEFFDFLSDLSNSDLESKEIDRLLMDNLEYLVGWFVDSALDVEPGYAIAFLETLDDLGFEKNKQWLADVVKVLDADKERIVRFLLTLMKINNLSVVQRYIDLLEGLGLAWPEFDIMHKSLNAGTGKIGGPNG